MIHKIKFIIQKLTAGVVFCMKKLNKTICEYVRYQCRHFMLSFISISLIFSLGIVVYWKYCDDTRERLQKEKILHAKTHTHNAELKAKIGELIRDIEQQKKTIDSQDKHIKDLGYIHNTVERCESRANKCIISINRAVAELENVKKSDLSSDEMKAKIDAIEKKITVVSPRSSTKLEEIIAPWNNDDYQPNDRTFECGGLFKDGKDCILQIKIRLK